MENSTSGWQYDLFEIDRGEPMWRGKAAGESDAGLKLRELSDRTQNECCAIYLATRDVVARLKIRPDAQGAPLVFHIAYDLILAQTLAHELPGNGYRFAYAAGNGLVRAILTPPMECGVFILGHAAPQESRREMAEWISASYPQLPIIAIKSPSEPDLELASYNLELDSDDALVPMIARSLDERRNRRWMN